MRTILIISLCTVFSISVFARMNPFEPTDTFNEKKAEYFKQLEFEKNKKLEEQKRKQEALLAAQRAEEEKLEKERLEQEKLEREALEAQNRKIEEEKLAQQKMQEEKKKALELKLAKEKAAKEAKLAAMKKKTTHKALPYVKFEVEEDSLVIYVDKKYRLLNQDTLKKQKKFLFNFRGKVSFYTVRKKLTNKHFKAFAIGNHPKYKYFRVVVDLVDDTKNYTKKIDTKKGMITIKRK